MKPNMRIIILTLVTLICSCGKSALTRTQEPQPSTPAETPLSCDEAYTALREEIVGFADQDRNACMVVLRLAAPENLIGWQLFCDNVSELLPDDDVWVREQAEQATGFGAPPAQQINPSFWHTWVYWEAPQPQGGFAIVNHWSGQVLVGGSLSTTGDYTYPETWRPARTMPSTCDMMGVDEAGTYDLGTAGPWQGFAAEWPHHVTYPAMLLLQNANVEWTFFKYPKNISSTQTADQEYLALARLYAEEQRP